jgi:hypothetical protein
MAPITDRKRPLDQHLPKQRPSLARRRAAYRRGHASESLAAWRLRLVGYRILARRYRTKMGEIDLVARRGCVIAFIEVKYRNELVAGLEAVTPHAQFASGGRRNCSSAATRPFPNSPCASL